MANRLSIRGRRISITGRLARLTRDEAIRRIEAAGGHYDETPDADTQYVVVGEDGWPLQDDGRLTRNLMRAHDLQARGEPLTVVQEADFVAALEAEAAAEHERAAADDERFYTAHQLSRILGVPPLALRRWVRMGLLEPVKTVNRLDYFDYRQVTTAKAIHEMTARGVTPRRIRQSLTKLRTWFPDAETALQRLRSFDDSGDLVVELPAGQTADLSGQLRLDFDAAESDADEPAADARPGPTLLRSPENWFDRGVLAEENGDYDAAIEAYHRALATDGYRDVERAAETCFNFGNALYFADRKHEAVQRFLQAVELDPDYVEAWNNLGNALADTGAADRAIDAFRRALAIQPHYADAHYNLADALEQRGERTNARTHWEAYLAEDPNSPWANEVRSRL